MSLSEIAAPTFVRLLGSLSGFLDKAAAHAEAKKIDPGTTARLAGSEPPKYADEEKTFEELKARLAKTADFIKSLDQSVISAAVDKDITFPAGGGTQRTLKGKDYLVLSGLPNFYFHVTTAYNILRHCGVELGKRDFLGVPASS